MRAFIFLLLVGVCTGIIISCGNNQYKDNTEEKPVSTDSLIKRGDYLVTAMGCDDCHSPKKMGPMGPEIIPELRLSGFQQHNVLPPVEPSAIGNGWVLMSPDLTAAAGPWGITYAANITSDSTGIGSWTEEQFKKSVKEGKSKGLEGTRPLLPPMPWQNFARLTDLDLKSIYTFLMSTNPVKNVVPQPILNQPKP
ncbi:MAG: diheme cytochrome c-553 [Chitinophagaceae bacterium]|nr:diheme cytochrome c-553 [Chitinophagaceae bacterium]MCW5927808.1 diheme cytochrome c-553 [Chitinophagaceae bacterium]